MGSQGGILKPRRPNCQSDCQLARVGLEKTPLDPWDPPGSPLPSSPADTPEKVCRRKNIPGRNSTAGKRRAAEIEIEIGNPGIEPAPPWGRVYASTRDVLRAAVAVPIGGDEAFCLAL